MHIFAFAVIIVKDMGSFESENFGNAYHFAKISKLYKANDFIKLVLFNI